VLRPTLSSPRNTAMDYLSRREHSRAELERKLKSKGFDFDEIEQALNKLISENLQSDSRFAQSYFHYRIAKGFGPLKIRHELQQKGVDSELIKNAEVEEKCDWFALLIRVAERKFGELPAKDLKQKQKCSRFLQQRGFAQNDIMRLLLN